MTVAFDASGVAETTWTIPPEAKLGDYSVEIRDADIELARERQRSRSNNSGCRRFAQRSGPGTRATASVGGVARPACRLSIRRRRIRAAREIAHRRSSRGRCNFRRYEDFQFGGAAVVEGITANRRRAYDFESERICQRVVKARVFPLTLDGQGAARVTVPDIPEVEQPSVLNAEMDYADANGEILTAAGRVDVVARRGHARDSPRRLGCERRTVALSRRCARSRGSPRRRAARRRRALFGIRLLLPQTSDRRLLRVRNVREIAQLDATAAARPMRRVCCRAKSRPALPAKSSSPRARGRRRQLRCGDRRRSGSSATDDWWFGGTSRRSHGPVARTEGIRTGRHRALSGADAVSQRNRARHRSNAKA